MENILSMLERSEQGWHASARMTEDHDPFGRPDLATRFTTTPATLFEIPVKSMHPQCSALYVAISLYYCK